MKKILSLVIALALLMSFLPSVVFADGEPTFDGVTVLRIEAEDCGTVPAGNKKASSASWTGATFSGDYAVGNYALNFSVNVASAGLYQMYLALETQYGAKPITILINGETAVDAVNTTVGYTKYGTESYPVELAQGINTFTVQITNNVRYDYVEFGPSSVPTLGDSPLRLEAENYAADTSHIESASKYSNGQVLRSEAFSTNIYVATAGYYYVEVCWGNKYSDNRTVGLVVAGETVFSGQTGITYGVRAQTFIVNLDKGINSVAITKPDGNIGNFYVDYIEFSPAGTIYNFGATDTLKIEAEDCTETAAASDWKFSGGKRVTNADLSANVYVEQAGTYEIIVAWGNNDGNSTGTVKANGTTIFTSSLMGYWKSFVSHGTVTLNQGLNAITIDKGTKLWVDYFKLSPVPTLSASSPLCLEAEDYTINSATSTKFFPSGNAYAYNTCTVQSAFTVEDAGKYDMTLALGAMADDAKAFSVTIDGVEKYNGNLEDGKIASESMQNVTEGFVATTTVPVTLSAGSHTLEIAVPLHGVIDYIRFAKAVEFSEEVYAYELADYNVDGNDLSDALVKTYLGNYDPSDAATKVNASLKALGHGLNYAFFEFLPTGAADYYLKVTYASGGWESPAAVIIDPVSLESYEDASASPATVVTSGTWLQSYSNDADVWLDESDYEFHPPYFNEKYFDLGALTAGPHSFLFMFDPNEWTNEGVSIRKVELLSASELDSVIYDNTLFTADLVTPSESLSTTVTSIAEANAYTSDSIFDDEKNTVTVVKDIFNNTSSTATFSVIAASYDISGALIAAGVSDSITLAAGESADVKVTVSTLGADSVKVFGLDMSSLNPVLDPVSFGH